MFRIAIAFAVMLAASTPAASHVVSAVPHGFELTETATVKAAPADVYKTLLDIASWWNSSHTYSGDAANLSIDQRPGGCWCERTKDGGAIEHMRIVYAQPGAMLRAHGGLGPLQGEGAAGSLTWSIKPTAGGSELVQTYVVGGYIRMGSEKLAPLVDKVMAEQFRRLVARIDSDAAAAAKMR